MYNDERWRVGIRNNPFSIVVKTHLKALDSRKDPNKRYRWKVELFKALHKAKYTKKQILELYRFMDWVLRLPTALNQKFDNFVEKYEEAKTVRYVTSIERRLLKRNAQQNFEQGVLQKSREYVTDILDVRFHSVPSPLAEKVQAIDDTHLLSKLHREAVVVESLDSFEKVLDKLG